MKVILIIIGLLVPVLLQAQVNLNYVLNGGFELYSSCPTGIDQIKKTKYWQPVDSASFDPLCTAEYCNACADSALSGVSVPLGASYRHYARSGNGMIQNNMYFDSGYSGETNQRDYTQGHLRAQLVSGVEYCVTFYVSLCQSSQYANNKIGAYLDNGRIDIGQDSTHCGLPMPSIIPQIVDTQIINDTLNWVKIQGSFTANGTERFITIGNFFDANHTDTVRVHPRISNNFSYYLIDDVSVIESNSVANAGNDMHAGVGDTVTIGTSNDGMPCTWYAYGDTMPIGYGGYVKVHPTATGTYKYVVMLDLCGHVTYDTMMLTVWPAGVAPLSFAERSGVRLYPNPATQSVIIEGAKDCDVVFCDVVGQSVLHSSVATDKEVFDISTLPKGIYFVEVTDKLIGAKVVRKVIKQ